MGWEAIHDYYTQKPYYTPPISNPPVKNEGQQKETQEITPSDCNCVSDGQNEI